jgi:hypothetical protein
VEVGSKVVVEVPWKVLLPEKIPDPSAMKLDPTSSRRVVPGSNVTLPVKLPPVFGIPNTAKSYAVLTALEVAASVTEVEVTVSLS